MKRSKLLLLLQQLDSQQQKHFLRFLKSPFFNENQDLIKLYEFLTANVALPPKKEHTWKAIFPKRPFDDQDFRHLCSHLLRQVLEFHSWQQLQADTLGEHIYQLKALNQPELHKHFSGIVRNIQRQAQQAGKLEPEYHYQLSRMELLRHNHLEQSGKRVRTFSHLEAADHHLDCFYITQKLKNYCELLGYHKTIATAGQIALPDNFLSYVGDSEYLNEPTVRAYYLATKMLLHTDQEKYFRDLREVLIQRGEEFSLSEKRVLLTHLINYCIDTKINAGRQEYFQELFSLYQIALEQRIIFQGDQLNPQHYKNIITIGLYIKEYAWSEGFIQEYTHLLPKENQENALNYNLAKVYFQQGAYEQVIEQLREVEYQNISYALGSKWMLLKTYYELGEFRALDSLSESFRIYLRRNKLISKDLKQQYLNVLRFTRKLSTVAPYDHKALDRIREQIEQCAALADKRWILSKLAALQSSPGRR
jgi:hypothetical protein